MRTLHVISNFLPAAGGPPEVVRNLAKAEKNEGTQIEVLSLDNPSEPYLADIPQPRYALNQSYLGAFAFSPKLWKWLRANLHRYDGVVMHGIWTFPGIAVRIAARRAGKPYGIFVHGALDPWFDRQYPMKRLKKLLFWPFQYPVFRDAKAVFFTADAERDLALTSYKPNKWESAVVRLGISDPEAGAVDPAAQIAAFHRAMPALQGRRYLLFLSRIHTKKGCDLLIDAFAKVASSVPDVDLVMAGPDQEGAQSALQRAARQLGIESRVHWPGMIQGDAKWGALRACEAFVLPSHSENFGIAIVEALAVGRPVLISNQVNIWQEIQADGAGLVEDDTPEGTERLLHGWFGLSPSERQAMVEQTRPCFLRRFYIRQTVVAVDNALYSNNLPTP